VCWEHQNRRQWLSTIGAQTDADATTWYKPIIGRRAIRTATPVRVHVRRKCEGAVDREKQLTTACCAGFSRRVMATLVDMAVFCGLSILIALPLLLRLDIEFTATSWDDIITALKGPWLSHASGSLGIWIAAWWAYFVVGWGFGATPGKMMLGLRVVDHRGFYPIGMSRALMRLVAYMTCSVTLCSGHLLVLFRHDRRALHDILAGTRVVRTTGARTVDTDECATISSGGEDAD